MGLGIKAFKLVLAAMLAPSALTVSVASAADEFTATAYPTTVKGIQESSPRKILRNYTWE